MCLFSILNSVDRKGVSALEHSGPCIRRAFEVHAYLEDAHCSGLSHEQRSLSLLSS